MGISKDSSHIQTPISGALQLLEEAMPDSY